MTVVLGGALVQADFEPECLDPPCESLRLDGWIVTTLEVVRSGVLVDRTIVEQVPDGEEHRVRNRDGCLVRSPSSRDP